MASRVTPKRVRPTMSLETLNFLAEILATVTVPASAANFDELATKVGNARSELLAAISTATPEGEI